MRNIKYLGSKTSKAFFHETGLIWKPGMIDTVIDDDVAAKMVLHDTVFEDLGDANLAAVQTVVPIDPETGVAGLNPDALEGISGGATPAEILEAVTQAETARDAAFVNANVYASIAAGLAAVADGVQFQVVNDDGLSIQRYRRDSASVATAVGVAYPSAAQVIRPKWAGRENVWPDPFFQEISTTTRVFRARDRWFCSTAAAGAIAAEWALVPSTVFDGKALRRTAGHNASTYSGPVIWLDEADVVAGETLTAYALFTGVTQNIYCAVFWSDDSGLTIGGAISMRTAASANYVVAADTPQWLRFTGVAPAGAASLAVYAYNLSGSTSFDFHALWAFKGGITAGPEWPTLPTKAKRQDLEILKSQAVTVTSGNKIDGAYTPRVQLEHVRGDAEMVGNLTYSQKVLGFYELATTRTLVTSIQAAVWVASGSTDVEWKVWVRGTSSAFNMSATTATLSGTVAAGAFPNAAGIYTLNLPSILGLTAGQFLFVAFRATDNSNVTVGIWGYDSGASPQRHSFMLSTTAGWNASWSASSVAFGYGQTALKFVFEGDELRAYKPQVTSEIAAAVAGVGTPIPEIVMPPFFYGVQGREANLYFDNLHLATAADYLHDVTSASSTGQQQAERFTWTPSGALASGTLSVAVADKRTGTTLVTKTAQQRAAASSAGTGTTPKLSVIGDSLASAGLITQTMLDIAGADAMALTLIGTQGSGTNKHEGRGGWTIANYTTAGPTYYKFTVSGVTVAPAINATEYSHNGAVYRVQTVSLPGGSGSLICSVTSGGAPLSSGTLTKSNGSAGDATIAFTVSATEPVNPFWKSGAVNYPQYLTDNSLATPDWVFVSLGINDVFSYTSDTSASSTADAAFTALDTLIASIKAAGAGVKVGIVIPTPPSASQDSFGANYGAVQTRWRFKRNILIWTRQLIAKYSGQEASRIYIVPSNTALDTVNNMQTAASALVNSRSGVSVARQSNGVHPATAGYQQIGDAWWAFLKCQA